MEITKNPKVCWNLTNKCNINPGCVYCYQSSSPKSIDSYTLSSNEKIKFLDGLLDDGVGIMGFSGGEPLLDKDLPKLIDYASSAGISTFLGSNGTLINKKVAKDLYNSGLEIVGISLDSYDSKTYNTLRGNCDEDYWKKTVRGIENCLDAGIKTSMGITVTKLNYEQLEKTISFGVNLGVNLIEVIPLMKAGRGKCLQELGLSKDERRNMIKLCSQYDLQEKPLTLAMDPCFFVYHKKFEEQLNKKGKEINLGHGCTAGLGACIVQPDLTVTPCFHLPDVIAGDLKKDSFKKVWLNSPVFKKLRDRRNNLEGKCGNCEYTESCGGCRAVAYGYTGNLMAEDPRCIIKD